MTDHRHITHDNYESWFLLYIDNELSEEQQQQVKQFVTNNPHLALDLEALRAVINHPGEKISFQNKGSLYKKADDELTDEELILFLDGEADNTFSERIAKSNSRQLQQRLSLLRNTYSIADASISYSKKDILYRRSKAIAMRTWLLRVAAATIVAAVGIWLFSNNSFTPKTKADAITAHTTTAPDTQTALVDPGQNDADVEEHVMIADINPSVTMPRQAHKNVVDLTPPQIMAKEKPSLVAVIPELSQAQLLAEIVKTEIEIDTEPTTTLVIDEAIQKETMVVAASTQKPKTKQNRFFKNVSEKIKETAIEVLSDDNQNIIVAGLAINVRK